LCLSIVKGIDEDYKHDVKIVDNTTHL